MFFKEEYDGGTDRYKAGKLIDLAKEARVSLSIESDGQIKVGSKNFNNMESALSYLEGIQDGNRN